MNTNPLVTVITVVRNAEKTIQRTLVSALNQKNVNMEVIVWDGLSTDNTLSEIGKYKGQYKLISKKDSGVYDAMNQALKIASGEWVLFLNADDYFCSENSLSSLLGAIETPDTDYVCGYAKMLFGLKNWKPKTLTDVDYFLGNPANHQSYLCKKNIYDKLGGFNLNYKYAADVEFMYRVIQNGYKGLRVLKPIVHYSLGGLSTKNLSTGVAELDKIRSVFLNSDVDFARKCRLIFVDGLEFTEDFKNEILVREWSKTQREFLEIFFRDNQSIESSSTFHLFKKRLILFIENCLKKFVFIILKFIPTRYI
ncbi:glycosyltransferase family 2 protein [Leptospira vanthielii]|uniref:Glycosyltransferase-like protein, family 2 n=1 Tax=Leptospira vanthielii serovar Holland str. Waz Holland = ATCC 700522 TaxID=1218591 RepID=N1WCB6_9LEPT|nr:glycosyltransferase family 2 protein [Leptospira vanthielii]EMY69486.1 glycosyltransferase-like protein, family 2 [Leptospira vanthielii serovar Holland str. Waz Holland = ATCC 700522]